MRLLNAGRGIDDHGLPRHGYSNFVRYSIMQPPMPHWGRPQPPAGDGPQVGKSREDDEAVCAAGTLSSFSSFALSHAGQRGCSPPRTRSSNSEEQSRQLYSYRGMAVSYQSNSTLMYSYLVDCLPQRAISCVR